MDTITKTNSLELTAYELEFCEFIKEEYAGCVEPAVIVQGIEAVHNSLGLLGGMYSPPSRDNRRRLEAYGTVYYLEDDGQERGYRGLACFAPEQLLLAYQYLKDDWFDNCPPLIVLRFMISLYLGIFHDIDARDFPKKEVA